MTQVWHIGIINIVLAIYRLAKKEGIKEPKRRGRKGYNLATKIAILAYVILNNKSYDKALDDLKKSRLYLRFGAKRVPSKSSISRWKSSLEPYVRLLMRLAFLRLARGRSSLLCVVDGSGFKLGRASGHYLNRIRKKAPYLLVTMAYSPEIDGIFDLTASESSNSELSAFWNYLFWQIVSAGIFWGLIADKRFDATWVIEWLESYGIVAFIPARGGKLEPKDGPRKRASERHALLKSIKHFRSLIESAYSSLKAFFNEIRSRLDKTREIDIVVLGLAYNVARLVAKGEE